MTILRNIQNNQLYGHIGGIRYVNLITGVEGDVPENLAKKIFKINLQATKIINDYPEIKNLISSLGLTIDNI
jgi:hypothetical protein